MASMGWSDLPQDILSVITKFLTADVEILRIRAVCSPWRAAVRPRRRPFPFPLNVPPVICTYGFDQLFGSGKFYLNYTTLYRISPPEDNSYAGDTSDGWLLRVQELSPSRFALQVPLFPYDADFARSTIPKCVNLLNYRITEVCKCYHLEFLDQNNVPSEAMDLLIRKVIITRNSPISLDFTALVLSWDGHLRYWRFGDKEWTRIPGGCSYDIADMVLCDGQCYAISEHGVLYTFDSDFNLKKFSIPRLPVNSPKFENFLVVYNSDLYVFVLRNWDDFADEVQDINDVPDGVTEIPERFELYKMSDTWTPITSLGDVVFVCCDVFAVGFTLKDFRACRGNCIYSAHANFFACYCDEDVTRFSICDLVDGRIRVAGMTEDRTMIYWPPPRWLLSCE